MIINWTAGTLPYSYVGKAGYDTFVMHREFWRGCDYVTLTRNGYSRGSFIGFDEAKDAARAMVEEDMRRREAIRIECEKPVPYGC